MYICTMIKLIVAGGRNFDNYSLLSNKLDKILEKTYEDIEIVSGKAKGADSLGERYAKDRGLKVAEFPADWNRYGKSAGYRRNSEMADYATHCVCFWDGISRGTEHMINLAKNKNLKLRVIYY